MPNVCLSPLSEPEAREICTWRYDGVYAVYNFSDWDKVVRNHWALADKEQREAEFLSVRLEEELIGYGRIFLHEGKAFIGIGLKPTWCGRGYGGPVMVELVKECRRRYPETPIALEVRSFNRRALKCYQKVGFKVKARYHKDTPIGGDDFYYMEYEPHSSPNTCASKRNNSVSGS